MASISVLRRKFLYGSCIPSRATTCQPTMGNVNLVGERRYFSSGTRPKCMGVLLWQMAFITVLRRKFLSSYLTVRCIPSRGTTCQPTMGNVNLVGDRRYFSSKKRRGTRPNCEPIDVSEKGWYWCMMEHDLDLEMDIEELLSDFDTVKGPSVDTFLSKDAAEFTYRQREAYINELKNEIEGLKEENANIKKQQQQPNLRIWMDDELGKALEEDDREEFLSVIDRKLDFFHSRQQQLLHAVCGYGSIKCAEALLKGDTRLTVELNHPCTDTGLYPLHCAALSLFPSIVELFLYYGARTDIEFRPCNPLDIYPQHLVEAHARKLPLHMALLAISRLPCIKEWSPKHTIAKLVTLLCLPRMQNPLETLNLLVRTTRDLEYVENEFTQLAIDGKVVEFAAMLSVAANMKLSDIKGEVYEIIEGSIDDEDPTPNAESVRWLLRVFDDVGHHITKYIKEDKYNVTKYQAIEDVTCMLQGTDLAPLELSDTDLSVYSWYRDEEPSYPSEAPYENVRLLHDVGMAHYSKSGFRWEVSYKELYTWRSAKTKAYIKEMENELAHLKEENAIQKKQLQKVLKPAAFGVPYILCQGVPIASSGFFSNDTVKDIVEHKMSRISLNFQNLMSTRGMVSMASSCNLQNFLSRRAITSSITSFRNIQNFPSSRAMTSSTALLLKRIMKHK